MRALNCLVAVAVVALSSNAVPADNLSGATTFLCAVKHVTHCEIAGECKSVEPWHINVPQFVVIDLDKNMLRTTKASGENRMSTIKNSERMDGLIIIQGAEVGRGFSFVITEETGYMSAAVAIDDSGVVGHGACTPLPISH
jgi:hypothetical protein